MTPWGARVRELREEPMLSGIDHVVVVTTDLDASRDELADLGFTVTPKARHLHYGTANHLCVFAEAAYLEILGVEHEHPDQPTTQQFMAPSLTTGGGVAAFALATDDATALHASLAADGIECTEPTTWTRDADTPSGVRDATFTTFYLPAGAAPGFDMVFACQQHTREAVWVPEWTRHANGARGLAGMSRHLTAIDDSIRAAYRRLAPTQGGLDALDITIGEQSIRLSAEPPIRHTTIELRADPDSIPMVLALETIANVTLSLRPTEDPRTKAGHVKGLGAADR